MDLKLDIDFKDLDLNEEIGVCYDEDGDRIGGSTLASAVVAKLVTQASKGSYYDGLKERVEKIRDEEIRSQIAADVERALAEPLHLTNGYGQRTGVTKTLHELVIQTAEKWLNESTREPGARHSERLVNALVRKQVEAAFKAEIADAVKAAKEAVATQLGDSLAAVVTDAVRAGLTPRR
jgi:hypothetical protein